MMMNALVEVLPFQMPCQVTVEAYATMCTRYRQHIPLYINGLYLEIQVLAPKDNVC
jgi:hypothetical protein